MATINKSENLKNAQRLVKESDGRLSMGNAFRLLSGYEVNGKDLTYWETEIAYNFEPFNSSDWN